MSQALLTETAGTVWVEKVGDGCDLIVSDANLYARFIFGSLHGQTRRR